MHAPEIQPRKGRWRMRGGTSVGGSLARVPPWRVAVALFAFALAVRAAYWAATGTATAADSDDFLLCDPIARGDLAPALAMVEYLGFVLATCAFLAAGGTMETWPIVQVLLGAAACVLLYEATRRALGDVAGVVAGLSLAVLWETFQWDVYYLTENLAVFALCLALWSATLHKAHPSRRSAARLAGALALLAVARPFGVPVIVGWLAWDMVPRRLPRLGLVRRPIVALAIALALAGMVAMSPFRSTWTSNDVAGAWRDGVVMWDDPTYDLDYTPRAGEGLVGFALANPDHLLVLASAKVAVFFLPVAERFSLAHNAVNLAVLAPMMALGVAGLAVLARERPEVARLWATPLAVLLVLVAATFLDYDWRYRAPAGPLFAFGAAAALARVPAVQRAVEAALARLASPAGHAAEEPVPSPAPRPTEH